MLVKYRWHLGMAIVIAAVVVILVSEKTVKRWLDRETTSTELPASASLRFRDRPSRTMSVTDANLRRALAKLAETDEESLTAALETITATWPADELEKTVSVMFAEASTDASSALLRAKLLCRWTQVDPAASAAWASSDAASGLRDGTIEQVALAWSAHDPEAAWNWVIALTAGAQRDAAMLSLCYERCRDDPAQALARVADLPEGPARDQLVEHAIANLALRNPGSALASAKEIEDALLRNNAFAVLSTSWAESDPVAAATFVADGMEPGPAQERAVAAIVQRWAQQDPAAVRDWIAEFPDGLLKSNALEHLAAAMASVQSINEAGDR